ELVLGTRLRARLVGRRLRASASALGARTAFGSRAHRISGLLRAVGEALPLDLPASVFAGIPARLLFECVLQAPWAFRHARLLAGQPAHGILARLARCALPQLGGNLALGVGELPCLELRLAERAALLVGPSTLHLPLELVQFLGCLRCTR